MSSFEGVVWNETTVRWDVRSKQADGSTRFSGAYSSEVEAAKAHDTVMARIEGYDLSLLNFHRFPDAVSAPRWYGAPNEPVGSPPPSHIAIDEAVWVAPGAKSPFRGEGAAATVTRVREGGGVDVKFVMGGSESDVSLARIRVFNPVPNADRTRSRTSHTSRADHDSRATRRASRASRTRYERKEKSSVTNV